MILNNQQRELIKSANSVVVCQAENPDGDSLGSALALEEILSDMGKKVYLHCPVQIPSYMRYIDGWDRVTADFPNQVDLAIIVDTSAQLLMNKTLSNPIARAFLDAKPSITLDHHAGVEPDLPFDTEYIISNTAVATGELIFDIASEEHWPINPAAATAMYCAIQSDSLGLTTANTTANSFAVCAELVRKGVVPVEVEDRRRELSKKSARVLRYKGQLIERIEYFNNNRTAFIHIPFSEIHEYSNEYNPTMLVLDEMRLVTGVDVALGIKTYPDGKLTAKIRSNIPISNLLAKTFGGDGHPFAAGFRIYQPLDEALPEIVKALNSLYDEYDQQNSAPLQNSSATNTTPNTSTTRSDGLLGDFRLNRKNN